MVPSLRLIHQVTKRIILGFHCSALTSSPAYSSGIRCEIINGPKGNTLILTLHVQLGRNEQKWLGCMAMRLKSRCLHPDEGAANAELMEFIARVFGVALRQVAFKQGAKSRRKVIEVRQTLCGPEALYKPV